ncbi:MAG: divalent-cation tolerance protein CutA [Thermoplasmata archaeon]|nr:divalent-cation tolerance protein CutA [Thermoplasmata archaeon]
MTGPPLDSSEADRRLRVVFVAAADASEARRLGTGAVEGRLAACANSWPIRSVYWWKGRVERAEEHALLLKTSAKKLGALMRYLALAHSYAVPDIVELQVSRAHEPYVRWLLESIDPESREPVPRRRARRPGSPRARAGRGPPRTRAQRRRRY